MTDQLTYSETWQIEPNAHTRVTYLIIVGGAVTRRDVARGVTGNGGVPFSTCGDERGLGVMAYLSKRAVKLWATAKAKAPSFGKMALKAAYHLATRCPFAFLLYLKRLARLYM